MNWLWLGLAALGILWLGQVFYRRLENYPPPIRRYSDMPNPATNSPPAPLMYESDVEEEEPAAGCDHGFPLESEGGEEED